MWHNITTIISRGRARSRIVESSANMSEPEEWNLSLAAGPIFWCAFLLGTCLAIAAFPHRLNRWTAVSILLVPACGAFRTGKDLGPDDALNDIYLRFVIILTSHITFLSFCDAKPGTVS